MREIYAREGGNCIVSNYESLAYLKDASIYSRASLNRTPRDRPKLFGFRDFGYP